MAYAFDPELVPGIAGLPSQDLDDLTGTRAQRQAIAAARPVDLAGVRMDRHGVAGVEVRIYTPDADRRERPAVLLLHGGGWMLGSLVELHGRAVNLCRELDAVVVTPEYRLAPEHPFPAGFDDCFATLRWLHASARSLGIDPDRVAVHGNSAGANLGAAVALRARDERGPRVRFQCLCSPVVDDRMRAPSMQRFIDTPGVNRSFIEACWAHYLAGATATPYAAPARADDLSGLPPAYVSAMEFDPLRDEAIAYAQAMLQAGVPVELHTFPGAFHGSYRIDAAVSRRELGEVVEVLLRALR